MENYDRETVHKQAKELISLCKEKNIQCRDFLFADELNINLNGEFIRCFLGEYNYKARSLEKGNLILPIDTLLQKVKSL